MVDLHRIDLTREQLDRIPDGERRLLVLVAHASNELNALAKLFHFAAGSAADEGLTSQAETMQAMVLARILTGKIYEFWQLLQNSFFGAQLSREYQPLLDTESATALNELKKYFGRENLVAIVRNKFAFHYAGDQLDAGYAALVDGDPLQIYLAKHNANTLFSFAETIAGRSMLEAIRPGDPAGAFESLVAETSKLVGNIGEVAAGLMVVCVQRHIGANLYELGAKVISVDAVPDSQAVRIPYFIEIQEAGGDT
ncbi:hypothetical protein [Ramlibacter sp. WS9]|uniref:hypothetical protein n=1 Tax=Ramlibacter sp. WS9 TaxID=1882741 RepID=UPI001141BECA|nr:hypothetical protein [Ramlibacter sp. WS9]